MKIGYKVVSINRTTFPVLATVNGIEMEVSAPGVVLEMLSNDGSMGHTFRLMGAEADEAEAALSAGSDVELTITATN